MDQVLRVTGDDLWSSNECGESRLQGCRGDSQDASIAFDFQGLTGLEHLVDQPVEVCAEGC